MDVRDTKLLYIVIAAVAVIILAYAYTSLNAPINITVHLEQVNPSNATYPNRLSCDSSRRA